MRLSTRALTTAYIVALAIVALMSILSHMTLTGVLREHESSASVINISGRQRMLSQRIASMAAQLTLGDESARIELGDAIDRFERFHNALSHGDPALGLPTPTNAALEALYRGGPTPLDAEVASFVARARLVATRKAGDPAVAEALPALFAQAKAPLLDGLNAVVSVHQAESERQISNLDTLQVGSLTVVMVTLLAEAFGIFRPLVRRIDLYVRDLLRIATTDPLTGVANRRGFAERGRAELARAQRHARPLCMLALDLDRFKAINDRHGHDVGDAVLRSLAAAIAATLRPHDVLGRMGGEEFAVLLPECDRAAATDVAERIRARVAAEAVPTAQGPVSVTVSIGVSEVARDAPALDKALTEADTALYEAKRLGRNRVVMQQGALEALRSQPITSPLARANS